MKQLILLTLVLAVALWLAITAALRSFQVFAGDTLAAVVTIEPITGSNSEFLLLMSSVKNGAKQEEQLFRMEGSEWSLGGDILKWKPALTFLGWKTCHKLTRVSSEKSFYEVDGGTPTFWKLLYKTGIKLPGMDALYGNAAFVPAKRGTRWGLYVSHTGYLIRPLKQ